MAAVRTAGAAGAPVVPAAAEVVPPELSRGRKVSILVGVLLGMLLSSLDQTIVGTAMPRVIAELNGLQHYSWVFTGYMLASTVTVPIYGKLSDIYGRRIFFMGGMALFLLGSALSGYSQSMTQLILFRGVQGLGAGAMMPIAQAIIGDVFLPAERARWQGVMMSVFGLSSIIGPALGGIITDTWGWRWVFYVNMPVGVVALIAAGIVLPAQSRHREHRIDYLGVATLIAAAVPMLLAFSWAGSEYPWVSAPVLGLLAWSLGAWVAFFVIESRAAEPIINPSLFKNRIFAVSVVATFLVAGGMYGATMYLPLFVQAVVGISAAGAGAALTPLMLGFIVSSTVGGQILARTGRYKVPALTGFVVAAAGMVLLSRMTAATPAAGVVRNMVVVGLGIGVMMSLFTIVVQNAFPLTRIGEVTASLQFFRSIGGTISVAILGTLMISRFQDAVGRNLPPSLTQAVPAGQLSALQNPQVLLAPQATAQIQQVFAALGPQGQALFAQLMAAIRDSLAEAITGLFVAGAAAMAIGFVVTLFLPEIPLRRSRRVAGPAPARGQSAQRPPSLQERGSFALARPGGDRAAAVYARGRPVAGSHRAARGSMLDRREGEAGRPTGWAPLTSQHGPGTRGRRG
jgi:EmrB/QacA subfamily drug resistance transporter